MGCGAGVGPEIQSLSLALNPGCKLHRVEGANDRPCQLTEPTQGQHGRAFFSSKWAECAGSCSVIFHISQILCFTPGHQKVTASATYTRTGRCGLIWGLMTPCMATPWTAARLLDALQVLLGQLGWPAAKEAGDSVSGQSAPTAQAPIIQGPGHRPAQEEFQAQLVTLQVVRLLLAARTMAAWMSLPGSLLLHLPPSLAACS